MFAFSVLCILFISIILCIVSPLYVVVYFIFVYTFTEHCHRV